VRHQCATTPWKMTDVMEAMTAAMEAEDTEEAVEAMAEVVEEVSVAAGVEAVVAAVATEDRAGKRSVTHVCILLFGFSEASRR
jgi:regulator of PEP synthase PpsR (kinase-PPPase family)